MGAISGDNNGNERDKDEVINKMEAEIRSIKGVLFSAWSSSGGHGAAPGRTNWQSSLYLCLVQS